MEHIKQYSPFYKTILCNEKVAPGEGDTLIVFYCLSAHEIWCNKRGALRGVPYKRGNTCI